MSKVVASSLPYPQACSSASFFTPLVSVSSGAVVGSQEVPRISPRWLLAQTFQELQAGRPAARGAAAAEGGVVGHGVGLEGAVAQGTRGRLRSSPAAFCSPAKV